MKIKCNEYSHPDTEQQVNTRYGFEMVPLIHLLIWSRVVGTAASADSPPSRPGLFVQLLERHPEVLPGQQGDTLIPERLPRRPR